MMSVDQADHVSIETPAISPHIHSLSLQCNQNQETHPEVCACVSRGRGEGRGEGGGFWALPVISGLFRAAIQVKGSALEWV